MKVKVLLFGIFSEKADTSRVTIEGVEDMDALFQRLNAEYPFLNQTKFFIAINKEVVRSNIELSDGDEIAIMPPFAGG